jgi:hypothetical protein
VRIIRTWPSATSPDPPSDHARRSPYSPPRVTSLATSSSETNRGRERAITLPSWAPEAIFGVLLLLGAVIVFYETRGFNFYFDDWDFVLHRRGLSADVLLSPHGPHLVVVPILIYKALLKVFGGTYLPFRVLSALDLVIMATALGVVCRRLWGRWWGLVPVLALVTLGSGSWTLLWSFEVEYAIANAAGLIALAALAFDWRWSRPLSCGLLILALASGSQGVGFLVGAVVVIALRRDRARAVWVVLVPAVLYGLWYLKYGHSASETHLSLWRDSLHYVMVSFASTISGILALGAPSNSLPPQLDPGFGEPVAIALIAGFVVALWRGWRPQRLFYGAIATMVALWVAASLSNLGGTRLPTDSRYLSTSAILLLVALCAAVPPPRLPRAGLVVVVLALLVLAVTNAGQYTAVRNQMLATSQDSRAQLGALLIMRGVVPAWFSPAPAFTAGLVNDVQAGVFYSAYDAFGGLPSDSVAQLERDPETPRQLADQALGRGEELGYAFVSPGTAPTGTCQAAPVEFTARPGTYTFLPAPHSTLTAAAGRFAHTFDIPFGEVPSGRAATVHIPADRAPDVPWRIQVSGRGRVCG